MSDNYSTGMDDALVHGDNFTPEERAAFADMANADGAVDPGAGGDGSGAADPGAAPAEGAGGDAGGAGGGTDGAADDATRAAVAAAANGAGDGEGAADPAAVAAAAAAAAGADDDDDEEEAPVVGADGKPAVGADGKPKKRRVSALKYEGERARAANLEKELQQERERVARFDERMKILSEALTKPKAEDKPEVEEAEPDWSDDIGKWIDWNRKKTAKLEQSLNDMREGKQVEDADRGVFDGYVSDVNRFKSTPEGQHWEGAYNHLIASRTHELALFYFGKDLTQEGVGLSKREIDRIAATVQQEERGIAENAIAQNRSPAQIVYGLARQRGFRPPAPAAAGGAAQGANGAAKPAAGAARPGNGAAAGAKPQPSVTEEIERLNAGRDASLSLSGGGGSPANPLTPQRLADMPQAEFDALMEKLDPEEFRLIVEGRA